MTEEKYERCVYCGEKTTVPINRHIDLRNHYVEGVGQLCRRCWHELYGAEKQHR